MGAVPAVALWKTTIYMKLKTSHLPFHMKLTNCAFALTPAYFSKRIARCTALGLVIGLGIQLSIPTGVQAAEEDQVRQGLPGRRISGASRLPNTACAQNSSPMVAIVPETNLGVTAVAEPTLWLSVPSVASTKQLEFYLFNVQDEIIYQTSFIVEPTDDLVGLDLGSMANAPKLEVNQRYRWAASIICNPDNHSENISVEGWVDRVEASNTDGTGFWYDQLGLLMEQLQRYPHSRDALSQWHRLMASARLDQIVPLSVNASSVKITLPSKSDVKTNITATK